MLLFLGMHSPNLIASTNGVGRKTLCSAICLLLGLTFGQSGFASTSSRPAAATLDTAHGIGQATFRLSADARRVADWIGASGDNHGLPFVIVDKINAELALFSPEGVVRATTPVLLGVARGDDSPPGIGDRKLSEIAPRDRITPAGRFVAAPGRNLKGQDILWVDYDTAIALHRATDTLPGMSAQSRADRLASATKSDNRASYGCINVSVDFYDRFIRPTFKATTGIVYILPETRSVSAEFRVPTATEQARGDGSGTPYGG